MKFEDKYSLNDNKKTVITPEAYAIGEMIEKLIEKIEKVRLNG